MKFESLAEYKQESNFKRCLSKLSLADVRVAITRSKEIMKRQSENGSRLLAYKGFRYYADNPSLSVWQAVEEILSECKTAE